MEANKIIITGGATRIGAAIAEKLSGPNVEIVIHYNNSKKEAENKGKELLNLLGIEDRRNHKPDELSGGEQQRVAVARALINSPAIILADEPSGNLDSKNADELHNLFLKLNKDMEQTFVVITHNNTLANLASRKLEIRDGKII